MNVTHKHPFQSYRWLLILTALALLTACGLNRTMAPFSVIAPEVDLSAMQAQGNPVEWGVAVRRPVADRTRDSERILVRSDDFRLLPYSGAVWLDNAPDLLRASMIEALESLAIFTAVGRTGRGGHFLVLETELRRFEAVDDGTGNLVVELEMRASLINPRGGALLAARSFSGREPASGATLDAVIPAFERVLTRYVAELGEWLTGAGQEIDLSDPMN